MPDMNEDFKNQFLTLSPQRRIAFLAIFMQELTVAFRASYDSPIPEKDRKLELGNELLHFSSAKLRDLILQAESQIPDDFFFGSLYSSSYEDLRYEVDWAVSRTFQLL